MINPPTVGSTYQWSLSGGGTNGTTTNSTTIDWGMTPGTYTVTVVETDVDGCEGDRFQLMLQLLHYLLQLWLLHKRLA